MARYNFTAAAIAVVVALTGCAASPKTFYANPSKVKDTQLCRTFLEAAQKGELQLANDTATEARARGLTLEECQTKVATEDAVLVGALLVGTAVGVGIACQNGCAGGGYAAPSYRSGDYDCFGGPGNGPNYIRGPVHVGSHDPHDLDRDGDGVGCELGDFGA